MSNQHNSKTEKRAKKNNDTERTNVLWKSFEKCHSNLLLILGLQDGFQVFVIEGSEQPLFRLLVSERSVPLSSIKPLSPPLNIGHSIFKRDSDSPSSIWPLFALTSHSEGEDFATNLVKIYSSSLKRYLHVLRLKSKVYGIATSSSVLAVSLEQEIHVFKNPDVLLSVSLSFDLLFVIQTFPNPANFGVIALGTRWLAAPGCSPLATPQPSRCLSPSLTLSISPYVPPFTLPAASNKLSQLASRAMEVDPKSLTSSSSARSSRVDTIEQIGQVASSLVSNLYSLGEIGSKHLSSYLSNTTPPRSPERRGTTELDPKSPSDHAGMVVIRDLVTQKLFCNFRAHDCPLVALQFDHSGSLLATVPEDGQYLHIYQILAFPRKGRLGTRDRLQTRASEASAELTIQSSEAKTDEQSNSKPTDKQSTRNAIKNAPRVVLLYRIYRGITRATIRNLSFSSDSKWMAVSSSNSTTHLFFLNQSNTNSLTVSDMSTRHGLAKTSVSTISASLRIKEQKTNGRQLTAGISPVVSAFNRSQSSKMEDLLLLDSLALLSVYNFSWGSSLSHATSTPNVKGGLALKSHIVLQTDFSNSSCSDPKSSQSKKNSTIATEADKESSSDRSTQEAKKSVELTQQLDSSQVLRSWWLSHVELPTFGPSGVPLWASPQFVFKSYATKLQSKNQSKKKASQIKTQAQKETKERKDSLYIEDLGYDDFRYSKYSTFDGMRMEHKDSEELIQEFKCSQQSPEQDEALLPGLLSAAISSSFFSTKNSKPPPIAELIPESTFNEMGDSCLGTPGKIVPTHFKSPPQSSPSTSLSSSDVLSGELWGVMGGEEEEYAKAKQLEQEIEVADDLQDDDTSSLENSEEITS